jgi:hypothetical protein
MSKIKVTTKMNLVEFKASGTSLNAKITRYNLGGSTPYLVAIRLTVNGKLIVKSITTHENYRDALARFDGSLDALKVTEYNIIIEELRRLDTRESLLYTITDEEKEELFSPSTLTTIESFVEGFEGNLNENLEVMKEAIGDFGSSYRNAVNLEGYTK